MEGGATGPKGPCLGCGGAPLALTHMVPPAAAAGVFPSHVRRSGAVGFGRFALVALIAPREVHILAGPAEGWSHQRGLFLCFFYPVLVVFCPKKTLTGWGTSSPPRAAALRLRWGSRLGCLLRNRRRRRTPRVPSGLGEQRVGFWGEKGRFWGSPKKGSWDLGLTSPPAASPPAAAATVEVGSPGGEGNLDGVAGEFFA